jgi:aromatic-L-amino-acid/L-tryptophan decarboxylase
MTDAPRHMTPDEFRRYGRDVVEWIAGYLERVERLPVLSRVAPGDIRARLPAAAPEEGEPFEAILADVDRVLLPGITHWQSPNFYAYFPGNASGPAVLGELLSAGLGVQGMLWATSPACTELETHVLDWLADLLGLPEQFTSRGAGGGVIQDTASSATLCALLAARERATDGVTNARGVAGPLAVYASTQAHSSVEKAVGIAGLGRDQLRAVPVDDAFALRPEALERAIVADRAAGITPVMVVATVGTTSSAAVDPVPAIGQVCRRQGVWLHVDAALAGSAAVCPELRWLHEGLEHADSYGVNPHKWLLTNFDCDAFYVADRAALLRALSVLPEYLRNQATESGAVIDYRDWQIPLGRRFRALKLWFVIRWYGANGLRRHIRHHVGLARAFADRVAADPRFEIVAPVRLSLVCFRLRAGDDASRRLLEQLNASGELYLTHTRLAGRFALRLALGGTLTQRRHVEGAWERIRAACSG